MREKNAKGGDEYKVLYSPLDYSLEEFFSVELRLMDLSLALNNLSCLEIHFPILKITTIFIIFCKICRLLIYSIQIIVLVLVFKN